MSAPLSILHVGCGGMASAWLKAATTLSSVRIAGLVDLNPAAAEKRQIEFAPGAFVGSDINDALTVVKPNIVFNCTVPRAHHAITCASLRAGAHVLSEKPLAESLDEAREIIALSHETNRLVAVTQNRRYTKATRTIKRLLAEDAIGQLTSIDCDFYLGAHFGGFREEMEHVLLLDMSIHHFDLSRFFSGSRLARVYCHEWNPAGSWYRHGANAHAIFTLTDDIIFNYRGSWCAEGCNTSWNGAWRFIGTQGSLVWDGEETIKVENVTTTNGSREYASAQAEVTPSPGKDAGHESVITEFAECIARSEIPETNAADNYYSLEMVLQAIESAETGRPS